MKEFVSSLDSFLRSNTFWHKLGILGAYICGGQLKISADGFRQTSFDFLPDGRLKVSSTSQSEFLEAKLCICHGQYLWPDELMSKFRLLKKMDSWQKFY